jgi:hypothetical protein
MSKATPSCSKGDVEADASSPTAQRLGNLALETSRNHGLSSALTRPCHGRLAFAVYDWRSDISVGALERIGI